MATLSATNAVRGGVSLLVVTTVDDLAVMTGGTACGALGDKFANTGQEVAVFANASDAAITITFVTQSTVDGRAVADRTASIPAGSLAVYGPFPQGDYNDTSGLLNMTYSTETLLTVKILKVTPA